MGYIHHSCTCGIEDSITPARRVIVSEAAGEVLPRTPSASVVQNEEAGSVLQTFPNM